ncbi:MAG: hypothetical protein LBP21_09205 [Synergistaceae bacterium]|jgi:succinyl-CoA synthetase beta subunit|nr:hypothetical protein [Synergistaceae bacterium]
MKLYEFQGKELLRKFGVKIPDGILCEKDGILIYGSPVILKAQVLSGGRGKAGAVVSCNSQGEEDAALTRLFEMTLKGEPVNAVLVEERVELSREYYLSVTFDGEAGTPLLIVSGAGGVEIEETADKHPDRILKLPFDSVLGPLDCHLERAAKFVGTPRPREFADLLSRLWRLWCEAGALLVEINPLAETPNGFVALDAKIELDDDAEPRDRAFRAVLQKQQREISGRESAQSDTITYVPLEGNIGLISDGAGTGMLTLDLLRDRGGRAADFCEMGGLTSPEIIYSAMDRVVADPKVRSLLIVLIGGFNRMDEMAEGIVRFVAERKLKIPLIVRLCGTMEEEGKKIMKSADLPIYDDLEKAVEAAVAQAAMTGGN